ncbi:hypothetical protein Tco_1006847 [Tanacetum coccineum]|uniref:Uncharacterized protein n=1 Tax=Tanacetum coccineum TaxID=301880 RepID=A0ABQ5FJI0_9ASTR
MKIEESLNVTFNETLPPSKTSPLVDDDLDEEEAIKVTEKKNLENDIEDETLEIDDVVNNKESRNHPLENVIGNLNQRTLRNDGTHSINRSRLQSILYSMRRDNLITSSEVVSSGWSFVSAVLGQMTYLVASLTLDSARSYVMHGASFTQGMISSIPIGGSISPEGFLPSILLLVVIIVTVVIVVVILVVVIVAIVRVVIVVAIIGVVVVMGGVSSILKLSFMIIGFLCRIMFYYLLHQPLGYGNGFLQSLRL